MMDRDEKGRFIKGRTSWCKGLTKYTDERVKIKAENQIGRKLNYQVWNKGLKNPELSKRNLLNNPAKTPEARKKLSDAAKRTKNATGAIRSPELRKRISNSLKGRFAKEKHPNWMGGKSFEKYSEKFSKELKTKIRQRDKFSCQICGKNGFCIHHIDYNKINNNEQNLITLCRKCHMKTNFKRKYWEWQLKIFMNLFYNYEKHKIYAGDNTGGHI